MAGQYFSGNQAEKNMEGAVAYRHRSTGYADIILWKYRILCRKFLMPQPFPFLIYPQSLSAFGQNKKAGMTERPVLPAPPPSCGLASVVPALRVGECSPDVERKQDRQRMPPKMGRLLPLTIIQSPDTPPCFTL